MTLQVPQIDYGETVHQCLRLKLNSMPATRSRKPMRPVSVLISLSRLALIQSASHDSQNTKLTNLRFHQQRELMRPRRFHQFIQQGR